MFIGLTAKCTVILVRFYEKLNFLALFSQNTQR